MLYKQLLTRITSPDQIPVCVHGTNYEAYENFICKEGLCRMNRHQIHCCLSDNFGEVKSGFRKSSEVLIYLNVPLMFQDDIPIYISKNDVILIPGIGEKGVLPPRYFLKVVDAKTKKQIIDTTKNEEEE